MPAAVIFARVSNAKQAERNESNLPTQQKRCDVPRLHPEEQRLRERALRSRYFTIQPQNPTAGRGNGATEESCCASGFSSMLDDSPVGLLTSTILGGISQFHSRSL
jgi:hypothetical protein